MSSREPSENDLSDQYSQRLGACQPAWRDRVDKIAGVLTALLWPRRCVLCWADTKRADLCVGCAQDLPLNRECCRQCAVPLGEGAELTLICGACSRRTPAFDTSFAPFRYAYPLDRMIQRLKYARELSMGRVLAHRFAEQLVATRTEPWPDAIVPVPLGRVRYLARGYNQAIELAQQMRGHITVPLRTDWVERARETSEQAALAREERQKNVRGAFAMSQQPDCAHVAILDDVVTTGSTVNEVAKVLRKAGVTRIEVWAIARAGR
jgi:ComF family protein